MLLLLQEPELPAEATEPVVRFWGLELTSEKLPLVVALSGGIVLTLVLLMIVVQRWKRRRDRELPTAPLTAIRIADLPTQGPSIAGPRLECYGTRIRLAVVVLAPVGRSGNIPPPSQLPALWESLLPGLGGIMESQPPVIEFWPAQLSSQGFTQLFFHHLALPGDRGRGSPWCSVAGKFDFHGQQFLVGLIGCAATPNGLGQITVQHQGLWLDVLRVRE